MSSVLQLEATLTVDDPKATLQVDYPEATFEVDGSTSVTIAPLKMGVIRPDASLIKTYTYDKLAVTDEELTIPAYTTSSTTIQAGQSLSETVALDFSTYDYYMLQRYLTIPVYNTDTKEKGRPEYSYGSVLAEIIVNPADTAKTLDGTKSYGTAVIATNNMGAYRMLYWSSATAISLYNTYTYGVYQYFAAPTISSNVMTVKGPAKMIRGSTTYMTSSAWGKMTDIRCQYVIDVYRAPKGNLNLDGWGAYQQMTGIVNCVNTTNHKLT